MQIALFAAQTSNLPVSGFDIAILLTSILVVSAYGLWMGRHERGTSDFFLAGKSVPWWAVAGSIFGTNVSSHHLVGMMGAGLKEGFAQANFEFGAIAGLMMLCYFFLPLYRRMGVYTLSEYLGRRYDDWTRLFYSLTNTVFLLIQLCGALALGAVTIESLTAGSGYDLSYFDAVCLLSGVAALYTVTGGLKAVIYTDVLQTLLLIVGAAIIAAAAIWHANVGGLQGLMEKQPERFHVFFSADHPELPWTGVLTGLMVMHFYFWGTNQFMVQRALGAKSDWDARMGIITAGYLKLLIPFLCIVPGMAAAHILDLDPVAESDRAFAGLARALLPAGYGLMGLVLAGLIGAMLSTVDSMLNSAATLITFDIYRKYLRPPAGERELIWVGRFTMVAITVASIALSLVFGDQKAGIFNQMVNYNAYLVPGVLVAFLAGILLAWPTPSGAWASILACPLLSVLFPWLASRFWGHTLQSFHRAALVTVACFLLMAAVSLCRPQERSPEREQYLWQKYRFSADDADLAERPWWQNDRLWSAGLVAITLALCWYFA